jgi:hypothetical protein
MSRVYKLKARLASGVLRDLRVEVSEREPWQLQYDGLDGTLHCLQDRDLFEAFAAMRLELQRDGCQLLCVGARPDAVVSGMLRSTVGGRYAYIVRPGFLADCVMVDIFDYADLEVVGTVQQQRTYLEAWNRSLGWPE